MSDETTPPRRWSLRKWVDIGQSATIIALALSLFSFYRSYVYVNQKLDLTVTEVSYGTNTGELYITVAFSNGGNRDAAVLRLESALWARGSDGMTQWVPIMTPVAPDLPVVSPHVPLVVKSGGVEVIRLSTLLNAKEAEKRLVQFKDGAFLGIRVATMASDGNLYLVLREGNAVFRIDPAAGKIFHVAGTGVTGYDGDGGPAKQARLSGPKGIAFAPDGSLYLADTESHTIRRVDLKTGVIDTVIGTGQRGDGPDGDPRKCRLARPHGIFVSSSGTVYVGDSESHRVRVLVVDGKAN